MSTKLPKWFKDAIYADISENFGDYNTSYDPDLPPASLDSITVDKRLIGDGNMLLTDNDSIISSNDTLVTLKFSETLDGFDQEILHTISKLKKVILPSIFFQTIATKLINQINNWSEAFEESHIINGLKYEVFGECETDIPLVKDELHIDLTYDNFIDNINNNSFPNTMQAPDHLSHKNPSQMLHHILKYIPAQLLPSLGIDERHTTFISFIFPLTALINTSTNTSTNTSNDSKVPSNTLPLPSFQSDVEILQTYTNVYGKIPLLVRLYVNNREGVALSRLVKDYASLSPTFSSLKLVLKLWLIENNAYETYSAQIKHSKSTKCNPPQLQSEHHSLADPSTLTNENASKSIELDEHALRETEVPQTTPSHTEKPTSTSTLQYLITLGQGLTPVALNLLLIQVLQYQSLLPCLPQPSSNTSQTDPSMTGSRSMSASDPSMTGSRSMSASASPFTPRLEAKPFIPYAFKNIASTDITKETTYRGTTSKSQSQSPQSLSPSEPSLDTDFNSLKIQSSNCSTNNHYEYNEYHNNEYHNNFDEDREEAVGLESDGESGECEGHDSYKVEGGECEGDEDSYKAESDSQSPESLHLVTLLYRFFRTYFSFRSNRHVVSVRKGHFLSTYDKKHKWKDPHELPSGSPLSSNTSFTSPKSKTKTKSTINQHRFPIECPINPSCDLNQKLSKTTILKLWKLITEACELIEYGEMPFNSIFPCHSLNTRK